MTETERPKTIGAIIPLIRQELGPIAKSLQPTAGAKYNYRSADQIIDAIAPLFDKYGVFTTVEDTLLNYGGRDAANAKYVTYSVIAKAVTFHAPDGSTVTSAVVAESSDYSDKATGSAGTYAYRTALTQTFTIPTGVPDPDSKYEEFAASAPARPAAAPAKPAGPVENVNTLKADISRLLGTTNKAEITEKGEKFFDGKPGWAESADALRKWRDSLKPEQEKA